MTMRRGGQAVIEYLLIVSVIAIALAAATGTFQNAIDQLFGGTATAVQNAAAAATQLN